MSEKHYNNLLNVKYINIYFHTVNKSLRFCSLFIRFITFSKKLMRNKFILRCYANENKNNKYSDTLVLSLFEVTILTESTITF